MVLGTPTDTKPDLGTPIDEIETPAVVVDLDGMEANVEKYARVAREQDVQLRSHIKTHKTPDLAHYQNEMTNGGGILCQTLSEVEVMAQCGIDDIYLSYMVVSESKLERLVWLSEKLDSFATTVDCPGNVDPLQAMAGKHDVNVDVILEIDPGTGRCGVQPGEPSLELAQYITDQPNLNLAGVMSFEGGVPDSDVETEAEYEQQVLDVMDTIEDTVALIEDDGIPIEEVKVGSTPTSLYSAKHPVVTEINPGMYPFLDVGTYERTPHLEREDCALTVISEVISTAVDGRAICDAGSKSISLETSRDPVAETYPDVQYVGASEEHGHLDVSTTTESLEVGDRIAFIPPHVCPTINLHDTLIGVRDGIVEEVWSVQARGKVK